MLGDLSKIHNVKTLKLELPSGVSIKSSKVSVNSSDISQSSNLNEYVIAEGGSVNLTLRSFKTMSLSNFKIILLADDVEIQSVT